MTSLQRIALVVGFISLKDTNHVHFLTVVILDKDHLFVIIITQHTRPCPPQGISLCKSLHNTACWEISMSSPDSDKAHFLFSDCDNHPLKGCLYVLIIAHLCRRNISILSPDTDQAHFLFSDCRNPLVVLSHQLITRLALPNRHYLI